MTSATALLSQGQAGERDEGRPIRAVVALEQPLFAEVLRIALTDRGGYDVVGACSSLSELRALAERCQADVILMDVESSTCDGLAVLRDLRQSLPSTAVLVLTAVSSPEMLAEAMTAGAAGCLSFESDMREVISAVRSAAQGQVVLSGRRLEALVRHLVQRTTVAPPSGPGGRLTTREVEVLRLLAGGASTSAIARELLISTHTARTHVQNVLVKLGVHSRLEAAAYAVRHGITLESSRAMSASKQPRASR
ncbi:MAG TPA: response regulator transcription factor [Mycobacteriales bacterium]|nr:response regulator transcription factor [Mycobacteriales bacterium]